MDQVRELAEGQIVRTIVYILQTEQPWSRCAMLIHILSTQDFEGQRLAEFLSTALLSIVGVMVSFSPSLYLY
jgi:hypothetical protein